MPAGVALPGGERKSKPELRKNHKLWLRGSIPLHWTCSVQVAGLAVLQDKVTISGTQEEVTLTIIIPVLGDISAATDCLESLASATRSDFEVIVVVDGAGVADENSQFRQLVIRLEEQVGPAIARNVGARRASGDVLLFLDSDITVTSEALHGIANAMEDAEVDAVFGSYDDSPGDEGFLSQYRNLLHHHVHQENGGKISSFWSGFGAVRTNLFLQMGGFHEDYERPCVEDIELGLRLAAAGKTTVLRPDLQVKHLKRWTAWNMIRTDIFDRALPWSRLVLENGDQSHRLNIDNKARFSAIALAATGGLLVASVASPWLILPAVLSFVLFLFLNKRFYLFLLAKKGPLFTLESIPWHILYFMFSSSVFGVVLLSRQISALPSRFSRKTATKVGL